MADQALHLPLDGTKYASRPGSDGAVFNFPAAWASGKSITWFYTPGASSLTQVLFGNSNGSNLGWVVFQFTDRRLYFFDVGAGVTMDLAGIPLVAGTEYLFALVGNQGGNHAIRSYCNAAFTGVAGLDPAASTTPLTVGRYDPGVGSNPLDGDLRDLAFFNRALTDAELQAQYLSGSPESALRFGPSVYYPLTGDLLDWSDGAGGGAYPLTAHGGVGFAAAAPHLFGVPGGGVSPLTLLSAAYVGGRVVLTWDRAVLDSVPARVAGAYAITPPGGRPAVVVTDVQVSGSTVSLGISGDVRRGGTYTVAIATAGTVRSSVDGGGNAAGASTTCTIAAVAFKVVSATPLSSTKLRVTFTRDAKQVAAGAADDALHAANYAIAGPGGALAVASVAATGAADQVDLTTAADLPGAAYTLTPSAIKSVDGDVIT